MNNRRSSRNNQKFKEKKLTIYVTKLRIDIKNSYRAPLSDHTYTYIHLHTRSNKDVPESV
jgi:hypothetical protein